MANAASDPKYRLNYVSGATATARRDSLVNGGPLKVGPTHYLKMVLPSGYFDDDGAGGFTIDLHTVEYLLLPFLDWEPAILDRNLSWALTPARIARLIAKLDGTGKLLWKRFK